MDMKLELVLIPVTDVDRVKAFYTHQVGLVEDVDVRPADGVRVVQRYAVREQPRQLAGSSLSG